MMSDSREALKALSSNEMKAKDDMEGLTLGKQLWNWIDIYITISKKLFMLLYYFHYVWSEISTSCEV